MEIKFVAIFKVKLAKSLHIRGSIEEKVSSMLVTSNALNYYSFTCQDKVFALN
jgi:hypothetical protein